MVQVMDLERCPLMLGAACIQHSTGENSANLLLSDNTVMYASQAIKNGDELVYKYSE